ncbi:protein of unknown function [Hyphomicrobium sp. 1Nfss2.1]
MPQVAVSRKRARACEAELNRTMRLRYHNTTCDITLIFLRKNGITKASVDSAAAFGLEGPSFAGPQYCVNPDYAGDPSIGAQYDDLRRQARRGREEVDPDRCRRSRRRSACRSYRHAPQGQA